MKISQIEWIEGRKIDLSGMSDQEQLEFIKANPFLRADLEEIENVARNRK